MIAINHSFSDPFCYENILVSQILSTIDICYSQAIPTNSQFLTIRRFLYSFSLIYNLITRIFIFYNASRAALFLVCDAYKHRNQKV